MIMPSCPNDLGQTTQQTTNSMYSLFKFDQPNAICKSNCLIRMSNHIMGSDMYKIVKYSPEHKEMGQVIWTTRKGISSVGITPEEKVDLERIRKTTNYYNTERDHPNPDAPYMAAQALWRAYTVTLNMNVDFKSLFVIQEPWIINAGLMVLAEVRCHELMETMIKLGANVHDTRNGYSILELVLTGIGYDERKKVKERVECVKILRKYGVTANDITHVDVKVYCNEYVRKSAYMRSYMQC
jgi:hypothetical protein